MSKTDTQRGNRTVCMRGIFSTGVDRQTYTQMGSLHKSDTHTCADTLRQADRLTDKHTDRLGFSVVNT